MTCCDGEKGLWSVIRDGLCEGSRPTLCTRHQYKALKNRWKVRECHTPARTGQANPPALRVRIFQGRIKNIYWDIVTAPSAPLLHDQWISAHEALGAAFIADLVGW